MEPHRENGMPEGPPATLPPTLVASTVQAVERILASSETALSSIRGRTEQQVRQLATELEIRAMEEAAERRARLEQVRRELADRAAELANAYQTVGAQLAAVEAALSRPGTGAGFAPPAEPEDPRVAAVKMTLRERQRIQFAYDEAPPTAAPGAEPVPISPPANLHAHIPRRRRWLPWQREAA